MLCLGIIDLHVVYQVTPLESSEGAAILHDATEDAAPSTPAHIENLTPLTSDPGEQGTSGDVSASQLLIETESYSDSYTHISPSPVSTSVPRALQEEEEVEEEERLSQGEEKGELRRTIGEGEK